MANGLKFWKNVGLNEIFSAPAEGQIGPITLKHLPVEQLGIHPALSLRKDTNQPNPEIELIKNGAVGEPFIVKEVDGCFGLQEAVPLSALLNRTSNPEKFFGNFDEEPTPEEQARILLETAKSDKEYGDSINARERGIYLPEGDPRLPVRNP